MAYIDPGSGSMMMQLIVASVLGLFIALRKFVFRFFAFLGGKHEPPAGKGSK